MKTKPRAVCHKVSPKALAARQFENTLSPSPRPHVKTTLATFLELLDLCTKQALECLDRQSISETPNPQPV